MAIKSLALRISMHLQLVTAAISVIAGFPGPRAPFAKTSATLGGAAPTMMAIDTNVKLTELLSTCIGAAQLGCAEITRVHQTLSYANGSIAMSDVDGKIVDDPRSALTAADLAAHAVIVTSLRRAWPGLRIVGEEDDSCDVDSTTNADVRGESVCNSELVASAGDAPPRLPRHLCSALAPTALPRVPTSPQSQRSPQSAALSEIVVFVDPLDGTREFVEGRLANVQTLIGISVNGQAIGGAVGLPFGIGGEAAGSEVAGSEAAGSEAAGSEAPGGAARGWCSKTSGASAAAVVYALIGDGAPRVFGGSWPGQRPGRGTLSGGGGTRPRLVVGDASEPELAAACAAALAGGGRREVLGGTGRKCLAVAEGSADVAIINFKSSRWDTCAVEALVKAAGGQVTDLFGERIVYGTTPPHLNACGAIASSAACAELHRTVCATMRRDPRALGRLEAWRAEAGLPRQATRARDVEEQLVERRELLMDEVRATTSAYRRANGHDRHRE